MTHEDLSAAGTLIGEELAEQRIDLADACLSLDKDAGGHGSFPRGGGGKAGWLGGTPGDQGRMAAAGELRRPVPVQVKSISEAVKRILNGEVIELSSVRKVNTVLTRLAAIAKEARARGEDAPDYDLCRVSVAGANLFCGDALRTKEFPDGVPRIAMPQLKGTPRAGSDAAGLEVDKHGMVNAADAFRDYLDSKGIPSSKEHVPAASLRASQSELIGSKVAGIMTKKDYDPKAKEIFISRDNYIVDGHHHWAAAVGLDAQDNKLGNLKMRAIRIDAPISEVLQLAAAWTKKFGIQPKKG